MAHSVAQVQLAPTGLKSISSFYYLKREKERKKKEKERERGQREERRKARTEEVKQVLYCLYSLKPHLFIQLSEKMNLDEGREGCLGKEKKQRHASCCCLKLDKAPPVNLLEVSNALLSPMLLFTCVSEDDIVCPETSSKMSHSSTHSVK